MVICPNCKKDFLSKNMLIEVFDGEESETHKKLDKFILFNCPHCHVFLDIKGPVTVF